MSINRRIDIALIEKKMKENQLRWFSHVQQRPVSAGVKRGGRVKFD